MSKALLSSRRHQILGEVRGIVSVVFYLLTSTTQAPKLPICASSPQFECICKLTPLLTKTTVESVSSISGPLSYHFNRVGIERPTRG
jgi:hypothetical protein